MKNKQREFLQQMMRHGFAKRAGGGEFSHTMDNCPFCGVTSFQLVKIKGSGMVKCSGCGKHADIIVFAQKLKIELPCELPSEEIDFSGDKHIKEVHCQMGARPKGGAPNKPACRNARRRQFF